jgi:Spy/CpxP family protein refolding chaperone
MNKKSIILSLIIGWFVGAGSGMYFCHVAPMRWPWHHGHEHFYKELQLTPDQRAKVDAIFKAGHDDMDKIFADTRAKMEAEREATRAKIRLVLSPEQQTTFDKLEAKWGEHFKKHMDKMFQHP